MENFVNWLQKQMDNRGMNQADLARQSGIKAASISRIMSGARNVGPDAARAIAQALRLDEDIVFQFARLMKVKPNNDETVTEIVHIYHLLNEDNKDDLLDYAKNRLSKQERGDKKNVRRVRVS